MVVDPLSPVQRRIHQAALRLFAQTGASQLNVSDLALEAGVARGTIYNNVPAVETLFEQVASQLIADTHRLVQASTRTVEDPAFRLSIGIRFFLHRIHQEPQWGAFLCRFALTDKAMREMLYSQTASDVLDGLHSGRYQVRRDQLISVLTLIGSSTLGAMLLVRDGIKTWRDAGSETAELILRALGVDAAQANAISIAPLPPVPPLGAISPTASAQGLNTRL